MAQSMSSAYLTCRLLECRFSSILVLETRRLPIRTTTTIINATVVKRILCHDSPSCLDNQQQTRALINGPRIYAAAEVTGV